jgi:ubiquinone/menaquinone biosynthesis C-methylase UbiE/glycosyltransferase involved in cell wall biosynthesis
MSSKVAPIFSIIVPTRKRPDELRRLLDSFKATTKHLDTLEVILVIDADDTKTSNLPYDEFPLKRVVVQPGLKMGELNLAGYEAAVGDYLMLLNDDVIVRTQAWDEIVLAAFKTFADGIVLVHVNDRIFEEKLCTFPFLSRSYCELARGICPSEYVRYRIDDHIYSVFNLLAVLGKIRILYLPDVVFEHTNYVLTAVGGAEYRPDEGIHEIDSRRFHELLQDRKTLALRLMEHIDGESSRDKVRIWKNLLNPIADSVALRRPEYIRVWSDNKPLSSDNTRMTIGVVSANLKADHARTCIDFIKKFTSNFDLMVLDNNGRSMFNHPHEMNKLLSICDTDYLVLMDDDVFVEPGWLDGMLRCMTPSVGVVTPLHKDRSGNLSYAGVVMRPDYSGHHTHSFAIPNGPARIQTLCSAIVLIDMSKCGAIRFDESYSKYFLDIDYGLQVWSEGCEVVCSPYTIVTHIGGGTLQQGSAHSNDLFETQRQHFVREWIDTGRFRQLEQGIWSKVPEVQSLLSIAPQVNALINQPGEDPELFRARALALFRTIKNYPALAHWAFQRIWDAVGNAPPKVDDPELGHLGFLLGCMPYAVTIEQNLNGLNVVLYNANYFAIPQSEGVFDYDRVIKGEYTRSYQAESLDILRSRIHADAVGVPPIEIRPTNPILIEQTPEGLNVILFNGDYYAIPQGEGAFDHDRVMKGEYSRCHVAQSIDELKARMGSDASIKVRPLFKIERTRLGSWRGAARSVTKQVIKRALISVFGAQTFFRIRSSYLQVKAENKYNPGAALWAGTKLAFDHGVRLLWTKLGHAQPGVKNFVKTATVDQSRLEVAENGDPQRWLNASPIVLVETNYRGYSIHRFEYKFIAVANKEGSFNYQDFKRGKYGKCPVAHSLGEVRAVIDELLDPKSARRPFRRLVFACLPASHLKPFLERTDPQSSTTLLVGKSSKNDNWGDYETISVNQETIDHWAREQNSRFTDLLVQRLVDEKFDCITIPWTFPETFDHNSLETLASKISNCIEIWNSCGERRLYRGENLHRLVYNKAYLASMFQVVPSPRGQTVLEAGCSDGLVCDIFTLCGVHKIVGIDVMETVGCSFPHDRIEYHVMDMTRMSFPDQSFDLVYSIATFEHLTSPHRALLEMLRATKVGGYGYVQAGPLYHSPFGHHMFAYFQDYPWIHLRKTTPEIVALAKERGIDKAIERDLSMTCERYVEGMLNVDHVNGLFLEDYRLREFVQRNDVEIVKFNISYEGRDLLTPDITREIPSIEAERLAEHGFEIAFRRIR